MAEQAWPGYWSPSSADHGMRNNEGSVLPQYEQRRWSSTTSTQSALRFHDRSVSSQGSRNMSPSSSNQSTKVSSEHDLPCVVDKSKHYPAQATCTRLSGPGNADSSRTGRSRYTGSSASHNGWKEWLRKNFATPTPPRSAKEILDNVEHLFPPRARLPVQVFDFGYGRAENSTICLRDIQKAMLDKPSWVVVRWLHVPLGVGLFQSSVEELFLKRIGSATPATANQSDQTQKPQSFARAGRPGWPYLETEVLNIRSEIAMKRQRDVAREFKELSDHAIKEALDRKVFVDIENTDLHTDLLWRVEHTGLTPDYWTTVKSDLPWLLTDGVLNMKGPAASARDASLELMKQALQENETYKNAYLARDPFRCFHREDGFLLTFSPATGHDYVTKELRNLSEDIDQTAFRHQSAYSAVAKVFNMFSSTGVDSWQMPTAEWLMVYVITEVITTPHALQSGYGAPEVLDAYDAIVHKLIAQRLQPWGRGKTPSLFRSQSTCIHELKALGRIYENKLQFLQRLLADCEDLELSLPDSRGRRTQPVERDESPMTRSWETTETSSERTRFAMNMVHNQKGQCDQLAADLTASLTTSFQLRSVEQNERSVDADSQSRAVFVFTAVTIVFLPLSFVTSYFGMNFQGGDEGSNVITTTGFWKIAGPLGLVISLSLLVYLWVARRARSHNVNPASFV